jgi:large-conductance mechanosensitive channel
LVFFVVFLIVALWPLKHEADIRLWSLTLSIIFFILGILNSKFLTPLNKLWFKFGIFLGVIITPLIMGIVYFLVVTPIGIFMRLLGKDLLQTSNVKNTSTYWMKRDKKYSTMKKQF